MRCFTKIHRRLRSVFSRRRLDRELDEELQYHLERQVEEELRTGVTPGEARRAALRALGAMTQSKEQCREARGARFLEDFFLDLRYAGRNLRRNPGFAALAILIMALGIGANTAVFSVVNAVLLRPLPYRNPDRIVTLATVLTRDKSSPEQVSLPNFEDWHDRSTSFAALASYMAAEYPVIAGSAAEYARAAQTSPEFFRVFGVEPLIGHFFSEDQTKPGGGGALLSYAYWQSHFGGDSGALGRNIRVYGLAVPVAGVMPPGFAFPDKAEIWLPRRIRPDDMKYRAAQNWRVVGRLKPGVSVDQAQTEMAALGTRLAEQYPEFNKNRTISVTPLRDQMVRDYRLTLYVLLGAVTLVLLIACANTATLLLGKAAGRTREVALRAALGASRSRVIRQLITESLLLSFIAGAAGLVLAYGGSKALIALAPAGLPRLSDTGFDRWVLAFTFGASILTSFLFGLVPALHASRIDLNDALKRSGTRSVAGGGSVRLRGILVVAETALAVVLLCGAGLLIKSFVALQSVALGFRPENVLLMKATVPVPGPGRAVAAFFRDVLPKIAHLPGVVSAGATMSPPGGVESTVVYFIDHLPALPEWTAAPSSVSSVVAPGTFQALGIPIKSGRDFNEGDTEGHPLVAVVNEALVRKSFAGRHPIGHTIFCPSDTFKGMTIIGVVGDVRQRGPARESSPECYVTYRQHAFNQNSLTIVARTVGNPNEFTAMLRRLAYETSPDVPVQFSTLEARLSDNVAAPRFRTILLGIFAALAVSLAMAGVYGVMAFAVGQRSGEIGIRMALGATTASVLRIVLAQGLLLVGLGLVLGLGAALAGGRVLQSVLFQVKPNDPLVYLGVVFLLGAAAVLASYLPARRASRIDPVSALRCQ